MVIFKSVSGTMLLCLLIPSWLYAAGYNCRTNLFGDEGHTRQKLEFSVYDKVYLQTICTELQPGNYKITAVWHNPAGQVQRKDEHSFNLLLNNEYKASFWIKLLKKGNFNSIFSNDSFAAKFYGLWNVKLYLNNLQIGVQEFSFQ